MRERKPKVVFILGIDGIGDIFRFCDKEKAALWFENSVEALNETSLVDNGFMAEIAKIADGRKVYCRRETFLPGDDKYPVLVYGPAYS